MDSLTPPPPTIELESEHFQNYDRVSTREKSWMAVDGALASGASVARAPPLCVHSVWRAHARDFGVLA